MMYKVRILLSAVALIALSACPPASAEDVYITAPSYTASNDISDRPITVDSYGWLHGIDKAGEWLEYEFDLTSYGIHSAVIMVKGTLGVDFHLQMEITGKTSHTFQMLDFNFTGSGFVG
jgi:hypothetical protein